MAGVDCFLGEEEAVFDGEVGVALCGLVACDTDDLLGDVAEAPVGGHEHLAFEDDVRGCGAGAFLVDSPLRTVRGGDGLDAQLAVHVSRLHGLFS